MEICFETILKIPGNMRFLETALNFIENSAKAFNLSKEEILKIRLASEEAVTNIIIHGLENDATTNFTIKCIKNDNRFEILLHEKGKPFLPSQIKDYVPPKNIEDCDIKGLGTFLMKKTMDKIEYRNLGRQGKETLLIKYINKGRIDNLINMTCKVDKKIDKNIKINFREFKEEDAIQISECAYSAYGYSYESYIYYPSEIIKMNKEGKMKSFVAEVNNGEIVAHIAFKFDNNPNVAEFGVAFTKQEYRGHNIFNNIADFALQNTSLSKNLKCLFGRCVTAHTISQTMLFKRDFLPTGLFVALFPSDVDFKNLAGEAMQKDSSLLTCRNTEEQPEIRNIFPPDKHSKIIKEIFSNLKYEITTEIENVNIQKHKSDISYNTMDIFNTADIFCNNYDSDTFSQIKQILKKLCLEKIDVVYLYIDLENPGAPEICENCENIGFFFSGILPFGINSHHALILQYLNNLKIDFDKIKLEGKFSNILKDYVYRHYEKSQLI